MRHNSPHTLDLSDDLPVAYILTQQLETLVCRSTVPSAYSLGGRHDVCAAV